ncbi:MAG TPA: cation:proton antiporter [Methylomirabilota bacterium]
MSDARWVIAFGVILVTSPAWAAAGSDGGRVGPTLFAVALLVTSAKVAGLVAERWGQPAVLGELVVGVGLGNVVPLIVARQGGELLEADPTLHFLAEVGVLLLLFEVGLESDLRDLVRAGPSALLVAVCGVVAPVALGWGVTAWLLPESPLLVHLFIGATLAATSVGITARVLRDLGAVQSREGQTILGAAVIDDVLGLVVLAVIAGAISAAAGQGPPVSAAGVALIVLRAVLFLVASAAIGHVLSGPLVRLLARLGHPELLLVVGVSVCFTLAFVAETMGLASIVGAFAAGIVIDPYGDGARTRAGTATLGELLHPIAAVFVPLFFVLMGVRVDLASLAAPSSLWLGGALVVVAIAGKFACALGVVDRRVDRLTVAIGMVPRGEVGLIFAGIGTALVLDGQPVLSEAVFAAVVMMVLVTTLVAPPGLRWSVRRKRRAGPPEAVDA